MTLNLTRVHDENNGCDDDDDDDDNDDKQRMKHHVDNNMALDVCVRALCLSILVLCKFRRVNKWKSYSEATLRPFQLQQSYDAGAGKEEKKSVSLETEKNLFSCVIFKRPVCKINAFFLVLLG